jgi:2,4-dienoyl-CoA reductase-like NADH-dependent reductase (Old Yellow Enzyme family)
MCQYSAHEGEAGDWHLVHLGARAVGGAGIVSTEAVHVAPRGRITRHCLGLWNDAQRDRLKRIAAFVEAQGAIPAIQLGHAGRKGSVTRPWEGTRPLLRDEGGWQTVSASALPYMEGWPCPIALEAQEIVQELDALAAAARRAREAGFKLLELHAAHGYLIHQFYSPLSNRRTDRYGGSFENRTRFLLDCVEAARAGWGDALPLFVRLSASDWVEGGWTLADTITLARALKQSAKVDLIDCSSGGNDPRQKIPVHPGYQVPFAAAVRAEAEIPTAAVGLIHSADMAESILTNASADIVVLGRTLLADPMWPLSAARSLKAENVAWPVQYERANIF